MSDDDERTTARTHSMSVASRRRRLDPRVTHARPHSGSTFAALLAVALVAACADDPPRPGGRDDRSDAAVAVDAEAAALDASLDASARLDATTKADVKEPGDATSADAGPLDAASDAGVSAPAVLTVEGTLASLAVNADGTVVALGYVPTASPGNTGAVVVYRRGAAGWTADPVLTPPDVRSADWFGGSVSLDGRGETLAVGSGGVDATYTNQGRVHVFRAGAIGWSEEARLVSIEPWNERWFGRTVALSRDGQHLAVASLPSSRVGSVEVFAYAAGQWTRPRVALTSRLGSGDAFGASLVWAETGALFVGAPLREVVLVFAGPESTSPLQTIEVDRRTLPVGYAAQGYGSVLGVSADGLGVVIGSSDITWHHRLSGTSSTLERRFLDTGPHVALDADGAVLATATMPGLGGERTDLYRPASTMTPERFPGPTIGLDVYSHSALALAGRQLFVARTSAVEVIALDAAP